MGSKTHYGQDSRQGSPRTRPEGKPTAQHLDRAEVLRYAKATSYSKAAAHYSISISTVARWAKEADMTKVIASTMPAAIPWADRRSYVGDRFGQLALEALELAATMIRDGKAGEAQKALVSAGIATDKAQLLVGGATKRNEHVFSLDDHFAKLMVTLDAVAKREKELPVSSEVIDIDSSHTQEIYDMEDTK